MSGEAQRLINVIRKSIDKDMGSVGRSDYRYGVISSGGSSYEVSAYLSGDDTPTDHIRQNAGGYLSPGDYIVAIVTDEGDTWVDQVLPYETYAKLAIDPNTGMVYTGDGTVPPENPGEDGQIFYSSGSYIPAGWRSPLGGGEGHPTLAQHDALGLATDAELDAHVSTHAVTESFINVTEPRFGAVGDGVTDDTAAIQSAIDEAYTLGAGTVFFPPGVYMITSTLNVNHSGTRLIGAGRDRWHTSAEPWGNFVNTSETTSILWGGTAGGTMISMEPADGNIVAIAGCAVMHMNLIGGLWPHTTVAATGLDIHAVQSSEFDIMGQEFSNAVMEMGGKAGQGPGEGSCVYNHVHYLGGRQMDSTGAVLKLTGSLAGGDAYNNTFDTIDGIHNNGHGIDLGHSDSDLFKMVRIQRVPGGTGTGVIFRAGNATVMEAWLHEFHLLYPGAGGVVAQGTETDTSPSYGNRIIRLDPWENLTPYEPAIGTGAELSWHGANIPQHIGMLPVCYPPAYPSGAFLTNLSLAAVSGGLAGAIAIPIHVPGHALIGRVNLKQLATANLRTLEWGLYSEYRGNTNLYRRLRQGDSFSFTPTVASTEIATISALECGPGVIWFVGRNTSATQTFDIGAEVMSGVARSVIRLKTTASVAALGDTVDFTAWDGSTAMPAIRTENYIGNGVLW